MVTVLDRRRTPAGASVTGSNRATTVGSLGSPARATIARVRDAKRLELRERGLDLAEPKSRLDLAEMVAPGPAGHGHDRAVGQEPVRRAVEDPGRIGELGLHRRERLEPRSVDQPVQVPPAAPVADQVEVPSGDHSGWTIDSSGPPAARVASPSVPSGSNAATCKPGRVPRHVRVIPFEPGEARPVRRQPRRRDEVRALDEDARVAAVERDGHDRVDRLAAAGVVLADGVEAAPGDVGPQVGVAPRALRRDRDGARTARVEPVQPAVGEVREDDRPAGDDVRPAAVLVHAGPDVERRRGQVGRRAVGGGPDEDVPAAFGRPFLEPEHVVAVDPRLAQPDDVADDVVDADRRAPGPVRGDGRGWCLDQVPCCHEAT